VSTLVSWCRSALLALLAAVVLPAAAQDDPPGRIGRIADLQGQVWLYDLESADWVPAARNRPLTTGDRLATDGDGRAELRIGSTTVRLGPGTEIDLLQVDDERVRVQLIAGQLALRLRSHETAREFELVTDEGRFEPEHAGRYRLDRIDAASSITVVGGQLVFRASDFTATVIAGQRADITRPTGQTQYVLVQPQRDAFADEVAAAEAAAERSVSTRYVSPEMTGAEALDTWGRWENDTQYGALWVPRAVVPGWAPYRYGHWAWVRPWGWTWVDDAPWGFAPFHYGRWVYRRSVWCWAPGQWVARPVYAPALVGWVGSPGVSISVNIGPSVGWFPLGPREVFVPPYRVTPRYVRNVNVTHVTNITNVTQIVNSPNTVVQQTTYVNRGVAGAVTVVPAQVVTGRQPVAPARVQLTDPKAGRADGRKVALAAQAPVTAAPPLAPPTMATPAAPPRRPPAGSVAPPRPSPQPAPYVAESPATLPKVASPPAVPMPLPTPKPAKPGVDPTPATPMPPPQVSVPPGRSTVPAQPAAPSARTSRSAPPAVRGEPAPKSTRGAPPGRSTSPPAAAPAAAPPMARPAPVPQPPAAKPAPGQVPQAAAPPPATAKPAAPAQRSPATDEPRDSNGPKTAVR
jgi:hypothetical protein